MKNLDIELVAKLDIARHRAHVPFVITSGYRTPEHNFEVGGVDRSSHTKGLAVDLMCENSILMWHMLDGLFFAGFKRIGIYIIEADGKPHPVHIHVDTDTTKPQEVVFMKYEGKPGQVNS